MRQVRCTAQLSCSLLHRKKPKTRGELGPKNRTDGYIIERSTEYSYHPAFEAQTRNEALKKKGNENNGPGWPP